MVNMYRVTFDVSDFETQTEISLVLPISSVHYISPLKSIIPAWRFCVYFTEEEKIYFLLRYGDKISDWIEYEVEWEHEDEENEDW